MEQFVPDTGFPDAERACGFGTSMEQILMH